MRTDVVITRGQWRGRPGWISGSIEDRRSRGLTKALVHVDGEEPEIFSIESLKANDQLGLFRDAAP
jgi:hypothetical protein